ncbi:MAG: AzlD domain-containing protein [Acidimicrobiaceae bacterium]|nr:AzlD domain-containing protein [Acidimicrobiaceae bacterium]
MIAALGVSAYALKMCGLIVLGSHRLPQVVDRCLGLIPAALLAALVLKDTFSIGQVLAVDARVAGFAVAVIAAWRRAPLIVVVVLAAAATALVRAM